MDWLLVLLLALCGPHPARTDTADSAVVYQADGAGGSMSWYDDAYLYRAPILIEDAAGGDVTITVPADWDLFWDTIQADGDDIRVTQEDGITLATYEWSTFTYASRAGVIDIDGYAGEPGCTKGVHWLYFGNSAATDGAGSFTASAPVDGFIHLGAPAGHIVDLRQEEAGVEVPTQRLGKAVDADLYIWWRIAGLQSRLTTYNKSSALEEVAGITEAVVATGGATQAGMTDADRLRIVETQDGYTYIRMYVDDGASGTDYTVRLGVLTTEGRVITGRFLLEVFDPDEP